MVTGRHDDLYELRFEGEQALPDALEQVRDALDKCVPSHLVPVEA